MSELEKNGEYFEWIGALKKRYRATQIKAAVSVNAALLEFYWVLGRDISARYAQSRLGNEFYRVLSADLKTVLPDARGLSPSSLKYSGYFYRLYAGVAAGQQVADRLPMPATREGTHEGNQNIPWLVADLLVRVPWGHHMLIIDKCKGDVAKALFYVRKTVENGWSRNVLGIEIDGDLYGRAGKRENGE
jgi:hypothetical protein